MEARDGTYPGAVLLLSKTAGQEASQTGEVPRKCLLAWVHGNFGENQCREGHGNGRRENQCPWVEEDHWALPLEQRRRLPEPRRR